MRVECRPMTADDFAAVEHVHWSGVNQVEEFIANQGIASMLAYDGSRYLAQLYLQEYDPGFREPGGWHGDRCWADLAVAEPLDLDGRCLTLGCYHVGWLPGGRRDRSLRGRGIGTALLKATIGWLRSQRAIDGLISWALVPGSTNLLVKAGQMPYTVYQRLGFREIKQLREPRWTDFVKSTRTTGATEDPSVLRVMALRRDQA